MIINDADVILYLFYILIGRWNKNDGSLTVEL